MSQRARRAWAAGVVGLVALGAVAAAFLIWQADLSPAAAEEGGAAPWDAATYRGVSELRSRVRRPGAGALAGLGDVSPGLLGGGLAGRDAPSRGDGPSAGQPAVRGKAPGVPGPHPPAPEARPKAQGKAERQTELSIPRTGGSRGCPAPFRSRLGGPSRVPGSPSPVPVIGVRS